MHLFPAKENDFQKINQEIGELILIFAATIRTARRKLQKK